MAGRHRAPEEHTEQPRHSRLRTAIVDATGDTVPTPRSARHRAGASESWGATRSSITRRTHPRRTAKDRMGRGSHRAPAATPMASVLAIAKNRPQVLLGTLVAAGLLLAAVPIPQDGGSTTVVSAAAAAVGVISKPEKRAAAPQSKPDTVPARPATAENPTASPRPSQQQEQEQSKPAAQPTEKGSQQVSVPAGDGPFNSLRTTGSRVVMLSFDDGPDPVETPKILALLEKHQVKAVFCLVGTQARRHPDLVRQIAEAGHVLCNHTWSHDLKIGTKKSNQILNDLQRTNAAIRAAVPGVRIPYFRAPGGNFTDRLVKTAYGDGMTSLYWAVDPRDWEHLEGESSAEHVSRIVAQVKKETRPGSIVLSHDFNQPDTTSAYEQLLPWLVANFAVGVPGADAAPAPTPAEPSPTPSATVTPSETPAVTSSEAAPA